MDQDAEFGALIEEPDPVGQATVPTRRLPQHHHVKSACGEIFEKLFPTFARLPAEPRCGLVVVAVCPTDIPALRITVFLVLLVLLLHGSLVVAVVVADAGVQRSNQSDTCAEGGVGESFCGHLTKLAPTSLDENGRRPRR